MKLEITQAQRTINENLTTTSEHQTITNISSVLHLTQNKIICKYIPNADGPGYLYRQYLAYFYSADNTDFLRLISVQPTFIQFQ
jgi:hypothetical protein